MINKENSSISTTYVPLQPPYQIIKYGHQVGMQIGTLIVVKESVHAAPMGNRNSLRIETHSYPVVTYGNKAKVSREKHLFECDLTEGVVWNRVELRNVSTICLSDSNLPWEEYIDMLWSDIFRTSYQSAPDITTFSTLWDLGVIIRPLPSGTYTLHLQTYCGDESPTMVRTDIEDKLALNVLLQADVDEMANEILSQVNKYVVNLITRFSLEIIRPRKYKFEYTTDEDILMPLVEKLNKKSISTSAGRLSGEIKTR